MNTSESNREFTFKLIDSEEKILMIDFPSLFENKEKVIPFEVDFSQEFKSPSYKSKNGELEINNFVIPQNLPSGIYKLNFENRISLREQIYF